jgi:hypothetical protein
MSQDAKAIGYLDLNITGFAEAITTAKRLLVGLGVAVTAFKAVKIFEDGIRDAIRFGDSLYHAAQAAGRFDPEKFFLIQKALQNAGLGAEEARAKIAEFTQSGNQIGRLFGGDVKYGQQLALAAKEYGAEAKVFGENAARFSKVFELLQSIGEKWRTLFGQATAQFIKPLQALLDTFQQVDFSGTAERFGKYIAEALNYLNGFVANGTFGTALGLSVKLAFENALDYFAGGMVEVLRIFGEGLLRVMLNSTLWDGVLNILLGIATAFGAALIAAVEKPLTRVQGLMQGAISSYAKNAPFPGAPVEVAIPGMIRDFLDGFIGTGPFADEMADREKSGLSVGGGTTGEIAKGGVNQAASGAEQLAKAAAQMATITGDLLKELGAIKKAGLFDTSQDQAKLTELLSHAFTTGQKLADAAKPKLADVLPGSLGVIQPFHVIADSLARIGGGGGFLRAGLSIEAQARTQQLRATEEATRATNALTAELRRTGNQVQPRSFNGQQLDPTLMSA